MNRIVRAPYFNAAGEQRIRGFRAFCAPCGYLTITPESYDHARRAMNAHRKVCPKRSQP